MWKDFKKRFPKKHRALALLYVGSDWKTPTEITDVCLIIKPRIITLFWPNLEYFHPTLKFIPEIPGIPVYAAWHLRSKR